MRDTQRSSAAMMKLHNNTPGSWLFSGLRHTVRIAHWSAASGGNKLQLPWGDRCGRLVGTGVQSTEDCSFQSDVLCQQPNPFSCTFTFITTNCLSHFQTLLSLPVRGDCVFLSFSLILGFWGALLFFLLLNLFRGTVSDPVATVLHVFFSIP